MGKETLSYEDTMNRLYQVRETAAGIAQVLDRQAQVAAQFRTCISEQERERQMGWPQNFSIRAGGNSLPQMTQTAVDSAVFGITGFLPPVKM